PNNKRKRVSKIKGRDKAHPYSRKARQINRAMEAEAKIAAAKSQRIETNMAMGQKVLWFRDHMDLDDEGNTIEDRKALKTVWTKLELCLLLDEYLTRNDEEIEEIKERKRPGRPLAAKDELVLQVAEFENKEARLAGLEVPELTNGSVVKALRAWDGDLNSIKTIKLVKCKPASQIEMEKQEAGKNTTEDSALTEATGMIVS
ncbi:translation machinery-associated protein 16, partial [Linderina pennispora]